MGSSPTTRSKIIRWAAAAYIFLLLSCRENERNFSYDEPVQGICSANGCGTFVATNPHGGVSASHFVKRGSISLDSGGMGEISYSDPTDLTPAYIHFNNVTFNQFYTTTNAITGVATYISLHGEFPIYIYTDRIFGGPEPIPGDSGSAVVQNGYLVGIVTHSIVDGGLYAPIK